MYLKRSVDRLDHHIELRRDDRYVGDFEVDERRPWRVAAVLGQEEPDPRPSRPTTERGERWKTGFEPVLPLGLEAQPSVPGPGYLHIFDPQDGTVSSAPPGSATPAIRNPPGISGTQSGADGVSRHPDQGRTDQSRRAAADEDF